MQYLKPNTKGLFTPRKSGSDSKTNQRIYFCQNVEIFVELDELDELDRITHA